EPSKTGARPGLDRPEWNPEEVGHLALRQAAPVRELDHVALALRQALERAVDPPRDERRLGPLRRAEVERGSVRNLRRRIGPIPRAIDDCVSCDRVQPRRTRAAFGAIRPRGAPE